MKEILTRGSDVYDWLRERGISNWTISQWGLGAVMEPRAGHEQYEGMVSIPYRNAGGVERAVRFRRLDNHKPKYLSIGGADSHLFAVKYASARKVFIVTGEFNTMVIHQMGFKAVGVPGDNAWQKYWKWAFRDADEIGVIPDPDGSEPSGDSFATKGVSFRIRVMSSLKGLPAVQRVITLPDDMDVNDLYLEDKRMLRNLLEGR